MVELAVFLKRKGYRPRQVQDFIPAPMDIATCMYHTGIDPETMKRVRVAKKQKHRALQRALLQYYKAENYYPVKQALMEIGREDLIGEDESCLIPSRPPRSARREREREVEARGEGRDEARGEGARESGRRPGYRWASRGGRKK
jgi:hypothetical protein